MQVNVKMNNIKYNWIEIGQRIESERKHINLSAEELAGQICTTRQTLRKWEKGEGVGIDINTIIRLANIFGCEVGYLLGEYNCKTRELTDIQKATGLSEDAIKTLIAPCGIEYYPNLKETLSFLIEGLQKSEGCLLRCIYEFLNTNFSAACGVVLSREKGDIIDVIDNKKGITKIRASTQDDTQIVIGTSELYEQYIKNIIIDSAIKERDAFNETKKEGVKSGNNS